LINRRIKEYIEFLEKLEFLKQFKQKINYFFTANLSIGIVTYVCGKFNTRNTNA